MEKPIYCIHDGNVAEMLLLSATVLMGFARFLFCKWGYAQITSTLSTVRRASTYFQAENNSAASFAWNRHSLTRKRRTNALKVCVPILFRIFLRCRSAPLIFVHFCGCVCVRLLGLLAFERFSMGFQAAWWVWMLLLLLAICCYTAAADCFNSAPIFQMQGLSARQCRNCARLNTCFEEPDETMRWMQRGRMDTMRVTAKNSRNKREIIRI